jgi:uncharacterized protein (TIGR00730 family)
MAYEYEINELAKEESWRLFRIMGELVEGFDKLSNLGPAVSFYGSARLKSDDKVFMQTEEIAYRLGKLGFAIITGGGPGIMEAANKGALRAETKSIGLNIELPQEQVCNNYTTKSITFRHFYARKLMLVKYATAFIIMPGGLGTLDELTEVLTLIQTRKIKPFPVVLFDSAYWKGFLDWLRGTVIAKDLVSEEDFNLLRICDETDAVINIVQEWYIKQEIVGKKAVAKALK